MHPKTDVVLVLSGGQDSATCLFHMLHYHVSDPSRILALTFNYAQRHNRELQAAADLCRITGVRHEVVTLGPVLAGRSPLTDQRQPLEQYADFNTMDKVIGDRVELTFVPMRNALFLVLAANRASALGATRVVTGVCAEDNANYPDCRPVFIHAMEDMVAKALGDNHDTIKIVTPLIYTPKPAAIRWLWDYENTRGFPALAFTHTAYDGQYPPLGKDHATVLRAHSFEQSGLPDPLIVRAWDEGLLPGLPPTLNYADVELCSTVLANINKLRP